VKYAIPLVKKLILITHLKNSRSMKKENNNRNKWLMKMKIKLKIKINKEAKQINSNSNRMVMKTITLIEKDREAIKEGLILF
jgi:hypothetical protein